MTHALLMERYPEIAFALSLSHLEPLQIELHSGALEEEMERFTSKLNLDQIDLLYIYGVGLGYHYTHLKEWLKAEPRRQLIFIEPHLEVIGELLKNEGTNELIQDPQVHLCALLDKKKWDVVIEELADAFPCDLVAFAAIESYATRYAPFVQKLRLKLLRTSTHVHARLCEALQGHRLVENMLPNIKRIAQSFYVNKLEGSFKDIPAIICGAGPSLSKSIETLKELQQRALIFAGGSTITALSNQGVIPHLGLALDPNHEEFLRLKPATAFEMPLLYGSRLLPSVFATCNGPTGYMRSDTGGPFETWMEEQLGIEGEAIGPDLGKEALSVTTLAVALAYSLGCNPIILTGVDLAYTGMERYAKGVMEDSRVSAKQMSREQRASEQLLRRKDRSGKWVYTLVKWVMESSCLSAFALRHKETTFINCTEGGIGFSAIPYKPLDEVVKEHCQVQRDLSGLVFTLTEQLKVDPALGPKSAQLQQELAESLGRLSHLCDEMLAELKEERAPDLPFESGKMTLLQFDFAQEIAFDSLLLQLGPAFDRILNRTHRLPSQPLPADYRAKELAKWGYFREVIDKLSAYFAACGR